MRKLLSILALTCLLVVGRASSETGRVVADVDLPATISSSTEVVASLNTAPQDLPPVAPKDVRSSSGTRVSAPASGPGAELRKIDELSPRLLEITLWSSAMEREVKSRVILPGGYPGARHYPVLYLFHGVSDDQSTWTKNTKVEALTEGLDLIVVMPEGGSGNKAGWHSDWVADPKARWETHHTVELVDFIDANYKTMSDRSGRLLAGTSMGGFGSMSYAARHPDLYVGAASFSGLVDMMLAEPATGGGYNTFASQLGTPTTGVWGDQVQQEVRWRTHNPTDLVVNLNGVVLSVVTGTGVPGPSDPPQNSPHEAGIHLMNQSFHRSLDSARVPHYWETYSPGAHTWNNWERELTKALPRLMGAVGSPAPSAFSYRTAEPEFSVYGWQFKAVRKVMEFLEVRNASSGGFTLTGSGVVTVLTPAFFSPGEEVKLAIARVPRRFEADACGRLHIDVDLGKSNENQEFTPQSDAEKLRRPDYFKTATVWLPSSGTAPKSCSSN